MKKTLCLRLPETRIFIENYNERDAYDSDIALTYVYAGREDPSSIYLSLIGSLQAALKNFKSYEVELHLDAELDVQKFCGTRGCPPINIIEYSYLSHKTIASGGVISNCKYSLYEVVVQDFLVRTAICSAPLTHTSAVFINMQRSLDSLVHRGFIKDYELSCTLKHVSFSIDSGWEFKYLRGQTIEAPDYLTELYGSYK